MDGERVPLATFDGRVPTDLAIALGVIDAGKVPAGHLIDYRWSASDGSEGADHFSPERYKALPLRDPAIVLAARAVEDRVQISLSADAPALFVTLESAAPGRFSDNCFALLPGAPRTVSFTPISGAPADALAGLGVRDLYTATH
jgi:beta-mannosidase